MTESGDCRAAHLQILARRFIFSDVGDRSSRIACSSARWRAIAACRASPRAASLRDFAASLLGKASGFGKALRLEAPPPRASRLLSLYVRRATPCRVLIAPLINARFPNALFAVFYRRVLYCAFCLAPFLSLRADLSLRAAALAFLSLARDCAALALACRLFWLNCAEGI